MLLSTGIARQTHRFDQIRLGLALAAVFGHSWLISSGTMATVPLQDVTYLGFHEYAVILFFFVSGLLVTEQARRRQGQMFGFLSTRAARLLPGLLICGLSVPWLYWIFGAWPGLTTDDAGAYAIRLVSLADTQFSDPEALTRVPLAHALNWPVWSLRYEALTYVALAIFALSLSFSQRKAAFRVFIFTLCVASACGFLIVDGASGALASALHESRFILAAFALGSLASAYADRVQITWEMAFVVATLAIVLRFSGLETLVIFGFILAGSYLMLCLAYLGDRPSRLPHDISFGIYIYGWPVQQLVMHLSITHLSVTPTPLIVFSLAMTPLFAIALLSWMFVEKPALTLIKTGQKPFTQPAE
ncbi:MAG: acyltransferase family protein [Cognatishimia sp.]|uniref:acyltransferase family protein n=1 Tax=Cognatishimia sp. TaxID=2211648 RepID=UPI004059B7FC